MAALSAPGEAVWLPKGEALWWALAGRDSGLKKNRKLHLNLFREAPTALPQQKVIGGISVEAPARNFDCPETEAGCVDRRCKVDLCMIQKEYDKNRLLTKLRILILIFLY